MNRVLKVMVREGVFFVVLFFFALIGSAAGILIFVGSYKVDSQLLILASIFVPAVVISLLIGVCMTLWKMKWPTREGDFC